MRSKIITWVFACLMVFTGVFTAAPVQVNAAEAAFNTWVAQSTELPVVKNLGVTVTKREYGAETDTLRIRLSWDKQAGFDSAFIFSMDNDGTVNTVDVQGEPDGVDITQFNTAKSMSSVRKIELRVIAVQLYSYKNGVLTLSQVCHPVFTIDENGVKHGETSKTIGDIISQNEASIIAQAAKKGDIAGLKANHGKTQAEAEALVGKFATATPETDTTNSDANNSGSTAPKPKQSKYIEIQCDGCIGGKPKGYVACYNCTGTGEVPAPVGVSTPDGKVLCGVCKGEGNFGKCGKCHGTGIVKLYIDTK